MQVSQFEEQQSNNFDKFTLMQNPQGYIYES